MQFTHAPKQTRSLNTQEKLLLALEDMLAERFFEQITIRDLADQAGVATGTIYRRFKDKEALLPVLYQRFDHRQGEWAKTFWEDFDLRAEPDLASRIRHLTFKHLHFYQEHRPILRTIYLYMRLHGELSLENIDERRQFEYLELLKPVIEASINETQVEPNANQVKLFLLLLITSINERTLFGDLKPVRTLQMDNASFVTELTTALHAYLCSAQPRLTPQSR
jgi:AcrR family transcriptional regulator